MNTECRIKNTEKLQSFTQLIAWKESHKLVLDIYIITKRFPTEERYCLVDQMRRCSVSITSNIAEGFSRQSYKEKVQFYSISLGSLTELQNQLLIARDIGYISNQKFQDIANQTVQSHKLIMGLLKASKNKT